MTRQPINTKIHKLTPFNVEAIKQLIPEDLGVTTTPTTATFYMSAEDALALVTTKKAQAAGKANAHPRSSLNAVIRKLIIERQAQSAAEQIRKVDEAVGIATPDEPTSPIEEVVAAEQAQHEQDATAEFDAADALPYEPEFEFYLDMQHENMFEKASARADESKLRCKACTAIVPPSQRKLHHDAHRAHRALNPKETKMAATATKTKKETAKDQGFPSVYLAANGNFKPGYDAAAKGDLVCAFLEIEKKDARAKFTKEQAKKLLEVRGWMKYVDIKRKAVATAGHRARKAAEARAAKAKDTATARTSSRSGSTSGVQVTPNPKPASRKKSTAKRSSAKKTSSRSSRKLRSVK